MAEKRVLVTGATAGFGRAIANIFARNGYDVIICGRRKEKLEEVKAEIESTGSKALALSFDIRQQEAVKDAVQSLKNGWEKVDVLVNNAGLAVGLSSLQEGIVDDWERMIDTNIKGLLYITRAVAPGMIERKSGHIINIGSIAGKEVYANGNIYCATKHAVDALNKAMRIDMVQHHIKVTGICPGLAETEFALVRFKGDAERAGAVYKGIQPLTAEDIAETAWWVASRPAHVNILDVVMTPAAQANSTTVVRK
ncbi:MAG: SDR family NAD(P)-dependent oxidoreductase [Bacteroidia bacterium]|nr:SDR family NAD(P)-dependent oxidoreductase [Bacteroidia bacterium]